MQRLAPNLVVARWLRRIASRLDAAAARRLEAERGRAFRRLPLDYQAAAAALVDWALLEKSAYGDKERWGRLMVSETEADLQRFYERFQAALKARGIAMVLFQANRSHLEQDALFSKGVSKARAGQSAHQYGCAVDVIHFKKAWGLSKREWAVIGAIGKEAARKANVKVVWGGDFKSIYDPAHWELADWRERRSAYPAKLRDLAAL